MNLLKRVGLYFDTIRYLTPRQILYQAWYSVKRTLNIRPPSVLGPISNKLALIPSVASPPSFRQPKSFIFLNLSHQFNHDIDWNYSTLGKLWTYNLNYFDFLHQPGITTDQAFQLMQLYLAAADELKDGIEPYPISLRGINWIKYFSKVALRTQDLDRLLYSHYLHLSSNIEYHLMGNHLLENACSLLFGAYYFGDPGFYQQADRLLRTELKEQILEDGAHFELTPMYHQILLNRLLDCVNLVKHNPWPSQTLYPVLETVCSKMLGWSRSVSFSNGDLPMVNDSSPAETPRLSDLESYAARLGIHAQSYSLGASGYRMIRKGPFELFLDVGAFGPDYIPGHAHCDALSFIVRFRGSPLIVEAGISTYTPGEQRIQERATESHNTVILKGVEQSDVWGSFRVGRRACAYIEEESDDRLQAWHDGYKRAGLIHSRSWTLAATKLVITDTICGKSDSETSALFHLNPGIDCKLKGHMVDLGAGMTVQFHNAKAIAVEDCEISNGFNLRSKSLVIRVSFEYQLDTILSVK